MPRLPLKLQSNDQEATVINQIIDYLNAVTPRMSPTSRAAMNGPFGIFFESAAPGQSNQAWHFGAKIEVDNTQAYTRQAVIHIQSSNSLVTTGIRDAANPDSGLVTSCAGLWVALQNVPAKATVDGNDVWNLPQNPMPTPDNLDDPSNFWYYLGEINC